VFTSRNGFESQLLPTKFPECALTTTEYNNLQITCLSMESIKQVVSRVWWKFEDGVISGCIKTTQPAAGTAIGDHAMKENTATSTSALLANDAGYDPIEDRLRQNIRVLIEAVFEDWR